MTAPRRPVRPREAANPDRIPDMKRSFSRKQSPRRGSAFVVVIGMLAVMILMGIAFATFIQTEQSGSTSLKNGLVARQSLNSALGRVMEAIDL